MTDARDALLRKVLADIAKEQNYKDYELKIKALPPTGSNFTSQLFFVTMSAAEKQNLHLFAKVAVVGEVFRNQIPIVVYDVERHFYTKLMKVHEKLQDENEVPEEHRLIIPKFYGCNETYLEEVVVLQDLKAEGFADYDRMKSIDWDYASNAVQQLAKLHALSIAYQVKYPDDYKDALKVLRRELPADDSAVGGMMQAMIGKLMDSVREENRGKLQQFFAENLTMEKFAQYYQPLKRPVLMHGDFRISNLMHKNDEAGNPQVLIVDYQTLSAGSALCDLLYFVFTGSDAAFRAQHYDRLIEYYYDQMRVALTRLHLDPDTVYPKEDFDAEVKEMQPYGLVVAAMMLPMITVETAQVTQNSSESIEGMSAMLQHNNATCAERFNEIVDDYVRWGLL